MTENEIFEMLGEAMVGFYEDCRRSLFDAEIAALRGVRSLPDCNLVKRLKEAVNHEELIGRITNLSGIEAFRNFVLEQRKRECEEDIRKWTRKQLAASNDNDYNICEVCITKTKEYLKVLDWDWYVVNNCNTYCQLSNDAEDWRWFLVVNLYKYYISSRYGRFINYEKHCRLERYLGSHGFNDIIEDHYGLLRIVKSWELKPELPPKVYVPQLDTHVIIRHVPFELLELITEMRARYEFDLSLRPDYNVCGDGIKDQQYLAEERDFGRSYKGSLTEINRLSRYYDRDWLNDWLIVQHEGNDVTFEEILEDGPHDQNNFVTQIVHMQYDEEEGQELITHIDHEYAFYSESGIEAKRNRLQSKGEARTRYKTFKIDNAKIPFENKASRNLVYKVLTCYFTKGELVDEFFRG